MNVKNLLPKLGEAPACAPFTQSIGVDPVGSAFHAELVVLVETPLPWPKPISDHPRLSGLFALMRSAAVPTRILACEPYRSGSSTEGVGIVTFRLDRSDGLGYLRTEQVVAVDEVLDVVMAACAHQPPFPPVSTTQRSALLVCTQGSHDVCCGEMGVVLADHISVANSAVDVFRVSHTGGHRFSPTALSMPDGRMWAFLSGDDVDTILNRSGSPAEIAPKCRGWIGAKKGAAQAAERAVFAASGWDWETTVRSVEQTSVPGEAAGWKVLVSTADREWEADVVVGREVPTISCSQPGGLPAKPGREFAVTNLSE